MFKLTYLYIHISTCSYIHCIYVVCWCFFVCPFCISLAVCVGSQYVKSECMFIRGSPLFFFSFSTLKRQTLSIESTAPNHLGFWTGCLITRIENGWEGNVQGGPEGGWLHIVKVLRLWTHHFPYSCRLHCRNLSTRLRFLVGGHPKKL